MDWLRNVLKGTSSSSSNFDGECYRSHEDSEDNDSISSAKSCDEENDTIGANYYRHDRHVHYEDQNETEDSVGYADPSTDAWFYPETTEEELALSLQHSLNVENHLPYDNIANYAFQPYPSFPSAYREWDQYGHNEINYESFWNTQTADQESVEAADRRHFKSSYERPDPPILCDVCREPVPVDSFGHPEYKEVAVFHQKYCRKHIRDGTAICYTCRRAETSTHNAPAQPRGTKYSSYNDGRNICGDCKKTAIMNWRDCQPLIDEVLKLYEDLDMKVWQDEIPLEMLDKTAMNDGKEGLDCTGLTTASNEDPVITTIRTPQFGEDNRIVGVKEEPFKLATNKHVKSIRLLNGCPRLYTGETLAHEMMHAWIRLEGYHYSTMRQHIDCFVGAIPKNLEEGFCQVMAHIWIESKIREMSKDKGSSPGLQFERQLAENIKHGIETRTDPEYGDSYRSVQRVVDKYGLKGTLNYVRLTGRFPE